MIERFYLKDYLSFKNIELNLESGLVVFTGPSGSGKSLLMNAILASIGIGSCDASICESNVTWDLLSSDLGIENEDINIFKQIKKEKVRYFINNQSISKKTISKLSSLHLRHLSLKDFSDFENSNLLSILDARIENKNKNIFKIKDNYKELFQEFKELKNELLKIQEEEKKIVELKEFATFEIKKIENISPRISEDEELLEIKKELSKKEKVTEKISVASSIFENEYHVFEALNSLDIDSSFFDDAMNNLRVILDNASERFNALEEVDIEEVLNRLEELSELKRRYGSIEEAIEYKEKKIEELLRYENIEINRNDLEQRYNEVEIKVNNLAKKMTKLRNSELKSFNSDLNKYLRELYLRDASVMLVKDKLTIDGGDEILIELSQTALHKVSTGEFNRLRLAILALKSEFMNKNGGVLMLDEIDANLSGEESMSVARVLKQLANNFQIFVISHQPQLTSTANQHFLISKKNDLSSVQELSFSERVDEIARIISGENISNEAKKFAKELLEVNRCA
ncbi:MAG: ATPase [Campylobacterota bacterium]|nr:ATPase [Campylobacterota bacterium]